ncbi:hypothetical protein COHA_003711 [Chlorella ohadii]|uniref:Phosphoglycerate mutase n=1 Tax=Chlorella ohadii TaxID=2649997 RepID=A0AAD5DRX0_9CHLO|nr:hypothetical protein COHA_003711 [Chlorella ohadii]
MPLECRPQQLQAALPRRQLLALACCAAAAATVPTYPASASGILQLPVDRLSNTYFLVAKTSTTAGLSRNGKRQVVKETYPALRQLGLDSSCWIWPSITQNAYQTAEVLAELHGVGRNRVVPEFSFLDARGVGELERLPLSEVAAALEAGDSLAPTWRPAPNVDGTVHESSADVLVRVRQLLSLLETQYNGDTVVIVSPDSDNLSVLQAAVLGVDLRSHHSYAFAPGEARRLELASGERPEPPTSFACPRPPQCI